MLSGKWALALGVAVAVVAADQLTKALVVEKMILHQSIEIGEGWFSLTYVRNTGAAFGLLAGKRAAWRIPFFLGFSTGAVLLLVWFLRGVAPQRKALIAACGAVLGGAVGNMIDRLILGEVIDFLDVYVGSYHWPAFNVADAAITVGVAVLCADALRAPAPETIEPPPETTQR